MGEQGTKACKRCGETKPLVDYYRHPNPTDGRLGKCKPCILEERAAHREKNIDSLRSYDRERAKTKHRSDYMAAYRETEKYARMRKKHRRIYAKRYPEKIKARSVLADAVRRSLVIKPSKCARCSASGPVEGHHHDYAKPLDVEWLCQSCHASEHKGGA